jgi:hypothetical protein
MRSQSGTARGFGSPARTQILTLWPIGLAPWTVKTKPTDLKFDKNEMDDTTTKYYDRILVAKYSPLNKCFVEDGGILILKPKKIKKDTGHIGHYFLDHLDKKTKSKYGWVKEIEPLTFEQFRTKFIGDKTDNETLEHNKIMLDSIQNLKLDTPVAATYSERNEPRRMEFTVHRVIFHKTTH